MIMKELQLRCVYKLTEADHFYCKVLVTPNTRWQKGVKPQTFVVGNRSECQGKVVLLAGGVGFIDNHDMQ